MSKVLAGVVLAASIAAAADKPVKVSKIDNPEKALLFEVTVPAKLDDVWRAFTTKEGAQEWMEAGQGMGQGLRLFGGWQRPTVRPAALPFQERAG